MEVAAGLRAPAARAVRCAPSGGDGAGRGTEFGSGTGQWVELWLGGASLLGLLSPPLHTHPLPPQALRTLPPRQRTVAGRWRLRMAAEARQPQRRRRMAAMAARRAAGTWWPGCGGGGVRPSLVHQRLSPLCSFRTKQDGTYMHTGTAVATLENDYDPLLRAPGATLSSLLVLDRDDDDVQNFEKDGAQEGWHQGHQNPECCCSEVCGLFFSSSLRTTRVKVPVQQTFRSRPEFDHGQQPHGAGPQ